MRKLNEEFFLQDVWTVSQALLGKVLVVSQPEGTTAIRITEVEAYGGIQDRACHAFGGKYTPRTAPMYKKGGTLYIYLCYGIHNMLNIVTSEEGNPCAVLIRAGEPLQGIPLMQQRRREVALNKLTVGPGSLTQAMAIPRSWSGQSIVEHPHISLWDDGYIPESIATGPRIGVDYAGEDAEKPWRYWIKDSPFISRALSHKTGLPPTLIRKTTPTQ
ncbi:MAG: DNA-3-methyladenine glycosylase [Bacteroidia bacterium]|nr:DNA-3-methyladenine glycosylase [Bacteroidia bacterium]MDW8134749.1 DNA-3-methyladenine glycosylase [Bacteroidia bacterium]